MLNFHGLLADGKGCFWVRSECLQGQSLEGSSDFVLREVKLEINKVLVLPKD